jgi:DNA-binding PadR family transcriptional regulator
MTEIPRLSPVETEILRLLVANGEMYGLELVAASELLKRGTIYVTLGRMADKGFVTSSTLKLDNVPGLPRRLFRATGDGVRALRAWEAANAILRQAFA